MEGDGEENGYACYVYTNSVETIYDFVEDRPGIFMFLLILGGLYGLYALKVTYVTLTDLVGYIRYSGVDDGDLFSKQRFREFELKGIKEFYDERGKNNIIDALTKESFIDNHAKKKINMPGLVSIRSTNVREPDAEDEDFIKDSLSSDDQYYYHVSDYMEVAV